MPPAAVPLVPSLFIGGLPKDITESEIQTLLAPYGTLASIALKKGYAFATFVEPHAAQDACQLDGLLYGEKPLAVRIQSPENMKKKAAVPAISPIAVPLPSLPLSPLTPLDTTPSLFVGGLPKETTDNDILALLSPFGTVATIALKRGYAFATFLEPNAAHAACALNGVDFGGKSLAVRIQSPENMTKKSKAAAVAQPSPSSTCSLFIGGLPKGVVVTEEDIIALAQPFGAIQSIALMKGYAFVNYESPTSPPLAAAYLNDMEYGGSRLAARPQAAKSPSIPPTPTPIEPFMKTEPSLFVGGISSIATEREIRLLFSPYGTIGKLTMLKGYCFIDYEQPGCAEKAIAALNGFVMDGKPLAVRIQDPTVHKAPKTKSSQKPRYQPY